MKHLLLVLGLSTGCSDSSTPPTGPGPTPGADRYSGFSQVTIEDTGTVPGLTHQTVTRAEIVWILDTEVNSYTPNGTVTYTENGMYDDSPNPPCLITASYSGAVDPAGSSLIVNPDGEYFGGGIDLNVAITINDSCGGPTVTPTQLMWFGPSAMGHVDPTSGVISGMGSTPAGADSLKTIEFEFTPE